MSDVAYFDALYQNEDPFAYRTRWYEARKRALTLASLPHAHYLRAWELGCSNGVLTAALAPRCAQLLATDISEEAVVAARRTLAGQPHVTVERAQHPQAWPDGRFDLIVVSEVGYYLDASDMQAMAARLVGSLDPQGVLVACHWRPSFAQARCSTDFVHAQLDALLPRVFSWSDADMVLQGWSRDLRSVAQREGLR
ncbi:class I SAM-dependent methyltransferase [Stenotrophomonas sp.]|uniref:class I SAM-dependent DNA methyltransferase n=1 Tax=Stenotrophomonas sp. TaxID=69392 RepID=UPI00289EB11C|nr:class I SAM-dependent methyltransferase [Stenotrophomonas sp.]